MATKSAEIQGTRGALDRVAPQAKASARAGWLSKLLKKGAVMRGISLAVDALALVASYGSAVWFVVEFFQIPSASLSPRYYALFYLPFLLAVLFLFEKNQRPELRRPEKELELTVKSVSLAFLLLICANFVVFRSNVSRYLMASWFLLALLTLLAARYGLRIGYGWLWSHGIGRRRTLLLGSSEKLFELQTLLSIQRYRCYELLGIVPAEENFLQIPESSRLPVLGTIDQWQQAVELCGAEQVIVAFDGGSSEGRCLVPGILKRCLADGIDVQVYSELFASRAFNYELDEFSGFFRFFAAPRWSRQVQQIVKKALDSTAGVVGSLITLAILPFIALMTRLEDGGPVFYRSAYVGSDGGDRHYLKFRSMRVDADKILEKDPELQRRFDARCKLRDDPRITRVGRFLRKYSIDELPEFFSVLAGGLSLVGPRTICRREASRYGERLPKLLSTKPGLTGFWQVMGRQLTTYEERIQMDMFYIDHWSIWLDLWIVVKTFWKVLKAEGAY